ncbi:metallophosphatase, putative [Bodo saltans]|uniref:Purple acid phosphatase n=1 Tax=Bodo saltans TaxID=75058 RepID=A0A0S4IKJ2_BODSA|nr:metallophosphatase, putative [Bodo saltans]|eukprot:CUE64474.1 metallophosphatase, putative [Bodo saltans]
MHKTFVLFATIVLLALAGISSALDAEEIAAGVMHPLEVYVRAATGNHNAPLTERDIAVAYSVETTPDQASSLMKRRLTPHLMTWFQSQLDSYPILTTSPEQIHIALTTDASNVTVLWTSSNVSVSSQVCYYREADGPSSQTCNNGTTWTYFPLSVVLWYGSLHGAHMTGLEPATRYCYIVGDPVLNVFAANASCFTSPQLIKDSITVALGGDMGSVQLFGYLVADRMRSDEISQSINYDAFWLLGDIAYSTLDPGPRSPNGEFFWDIFMRQEESFANHVPMLVTYGNHDFDAGDSAAFINRYRNPQGGEGYDNFYWSYTHGPVKFVSMCTEVALVPTICDFAPGSAQYVWLEQQFASVNRTETPWLILGGHRPMYSSDLATDSGPLQLYIEPLLKKYNVDVQLAGHMHETELVAPVFNNTPFLTGVTKAEGSNSWTVVNPQAPMHITAGSLGAVQDESYPSVEYDWSLFHSGTLFDDAYGYVRLVANRSSLQFIFAKQEDGSTLWEVTVQKTLA